MKVLKKFTEWLLRVFWQKPTEAVQQKRVVVKAAEVMHAWTIVEYQGTKIPIRKEEIPMWNILPNKERKKMAAALIRAKKKGHVKAVEIEGKKVLIQTRKS